MVGTVLADLYDEAHAQSRAVQRCRDAAAAEPDAAARLDLLIDRLRHEHTLATLDTCIERESAPGLTW